jgi:hypothetical protein
MIQDGPFDHSVPFMGAYAPDFIGQGDKPQPGGADDAATAPVSRIFHIDISFRHCGR